jgi:hypothetical protein
MLQTIMYNIYLENVLSREAQDEYICRACGEHFDSLGDLQHHILVEHHQKGDIVEERREAKAA